MITSVSHGWLAAKTCLCSIVHITNSVFKFAKKCFNTLLHMFGTKHLCKCLLELVTCKIKHGTMSFLLFLFYM